MKSTKDKKYDLTARKNRELSAILEVSSVLTKSFNLEKNLTSVIETLGSLLEMQRGCVFLLDPLSKHLRIVAAPVCSTLPQPSLTRILHTTSTITHTNSPHYLNHHS
ncbi:MAG: hypothetical protein L0922_06990, partial [Candidatus Mariimomonas ferrooxydans]